MLQEFTWQQFLVAAMVLSLLWYLGGWFFWLRRRSRGTGVGTAKSSRVVPELLSSVGGRPLPEKVQADDLMGKPRLPAGMELLSGSELGFAGADGTAGRSDQLGLVPDLLEELKLLFRELAERDGNRHDFFRGLDRLKAGFPKMAGHPQLAAVNEFIIDHAPFHLSAEDMERLWY